MKADLHMHSKYSDGALNVAEIVERATDKGLDIIAITDHNNLGASSDIKTINSKLKILMGVELSSRMNKETIHILGYFYKNANSFDALEKHLYRRKLEIEKKMYETLDKLKKHFGLVITYEEILFYIYGIQGDNDYGINIEIGTSQIAHAMEVKYLISFEEVMSKYLGEGQPAYVSPQKINTKDAVELLKDTGAIVSLAHPCFVKKNELEEVLKECCFDGIEVIHPKNSAKNRSEYYSLAEKFDLIITGGSDFHGNGTGAEMGSALLEDEEADIFINRLERK